MKEGKMKAVNIKLHNEELIETLLNKDKEYKEYVKKVVLKMIVKMKNKIKNIIIYYNHIIN